jgi:hypothetical protein
MKLKKFLLAMFAIAVALVLTNGASAQTYNFSFTGDNTGPDANVVGSGSLTVVGGFVTSMTGTLDVPVGDATPNSGTISLIAPFGYAGNDNAWVSSGNPSYFDFAGVSFVVNSVDYNLFYQNDTFVLDSVANPVGYPDPSTPITFAAPEGSGMSMLALCGLGLAAALFFKGRHGLFVNR